MQSRNVLLILSIIFLIVMLIFSIYKKHKPNPWENIVTDAYMSGIRVGFSACTNGYTFTEASNEFIKTWGKVRKENNKGLLK